MGTIMQEAPPIDRVPPMVSEATAEAYVVHEDGRILDCNDRLERLLGYRREELLSGINLFDLIAAEDRDTVRGRARSGTPGAYASTLLRRDGSRVRVEIGIAQFQVEGRRFRMCGIRDLTALEAVEARMSDALAEAERREEQTARLDAVLRTATDAVITIDERGIVLAVNPALTRILGYGPQEVVGRDVAMLMPEPYASRHGGFLAAYLRTGERSVLGSKREVPALHKDGSTVPMDLSVNEAVVKGRRLFIGLLSDLRERKAAEVALLRATEEAVAANEAKTHFLAHMSHELRTPLNAILGFAELMDQRMLGPLGNDAYGDYVGHIRDSATSLTHAIEAILEMARLGTRRIDPADLQEIGCLSMVRDAVAEMAERLEARHVSAEVSDCGADLRARVEPSAFRRVLMALIDNAIKFSAAGGTIRLACTGGRGEVVVSVSDTGCGMDAETIRQVCEPFQAGPALLSDTRRGIGLGLSIAREVVHLHGGRLEIDSLLGQGTTIRCILPAPVTVSGMRHERSLLPVA